MIRHLTGINQWEENWTLEVQRKLEDHWTNKLDDCRFEESSEKKKFYVLPMFPYPSGNLHMGHVRVYTISDVFARYNRLLGKNVLHPMGWDAFGLPAENAAIERDLDPETWTQKNIANMKSLMEDLNLSFDWDREFATCDSDYYKWTQYFFLKLYENDLVYKKEAFVNWDPVDQTVLANEQVSESGLSWRSGAQVEKKLLSQWFVRTTNFWESLLMGLKDPILYDWGEIVKVQEHWLGKESGVIFNFNVVENESDLKHKYVTVWMKKPEFIHKVKYLAVDPESVWNSGLVTSGRLPYKVKNPLTGDVLPVFATKMLKYPQCTESCVGVPEVFANDKLYAHSVNLKYQTSDPITASEEELADFREQICQDARKLGIGGHKTSSKLKDWLISRQRCWGTPIPVVYCEKCEGPQLVPESELPVKLPNIRRIARGKNPLLDAKEWLNTTCPKCGGPATRETDTMDTFVDSAWYFLRYIDPDNRAAPFNVEKVKKMMPVDLYIGGEEHAVLHLYFARFFSHFLHSAGLLPQREPFIRLLPQGIVRGKTYQVESTKEYVHPSMVEFVEDKALHKETRENLIVDWQKMSKSKYNGVEPKEILEMYGTDVTRLIILADVGPKLPRDWDKNAFPGILNWQGRMWKLVSSFIKIKNENLPSPKDPEALNKLKEEEVRLKDCRNYCLDMVNYSMDKTLNISMAITKMQSLTNALMKTEKDVVAFSVEYERALSLLIILLSPLAPYTASELWAGFVSAPNSLMTLNEIHRDKSVLRQNWPQIDSTYVSKFTTMKGTHKSRSDKERKRKKKEQAMRETDVAEENLKKSKV